MNGNVVILQGVPDLNDAVPQQRDIWEVLRCGSSPRGHFVFKGLLDHQTIRPWSLGLAALTYTVLQVKGRLRPLVLAVFFFGKVLNPTLSTKRQVQLAKKEKCFYACSYMIYMYVLYLYRSIHAYSTYIVVPNHLTFRWQCLSRVSVRSSCPGIGKWNDKKCLLRIFQYQFGIKDF